MFLNNSFNSLPKFLGSNHAINLSEYINLPKIEHNIPPIKNGNKIISDTVKNILDLVFSFKKFSFIYIKTLICTIQI